jgi:hypothetical protein
MQTLRETLNKQQTVIPAKAGIQKCQVRRESAAFFDLQPFWLEVDALDSRLRGNDGANQSVAYMNASRLCKLSVF